MKKKDVIKSFEDCLSNIIEVYKEKIKDMRKK